MHVAKYHEYVNGNTNVRHSGVTYKWPDRRAEEDLPVLPARPGAGVPGAVPGDGDPQGLTVYKYVCDTGDQPFKVLGTLPGTYNDIRTVYVEPQTGAIIDGTERQVQKLSDGRVALDTTLSFDKTSIDFQANYAKDKIDQLSWRRCGVR